MRLSYLDQVLTLMVEQTKDRVSKDLATVLAKDLLVCFNRARDRQEEGSQLWAARCMILLQVSQSVKRALRGKDLDDVEALEGVLIQALTKVPKNLRTTKPIIP